MLKIRKEYRGVKKGVEFGTWEVLGPPFRLTVGSRFRWFAVCKCGCSRVVVVNVESLFRGISSCCKSCQVSEASITHGATGTRLYKIWGQMKQRCTNPNFEHWTDYGGRGIGVCQEWFDSFETFRDWSLSNGYADNLTIDRKDNDGNYEPGNCEWKTKTGQQRNKRTNVMLTLGDRTMCIAEWEEELGFKSGTLGARLARGWSIEDTLTRPVNR